VVIIYYIKLSSIFLFSLFLYLLIVKDFRPKVVLTSKLSMLYIIRTSNLTIYSTEFYLNCINKFNSMVQLCKGYSTLKAVMRANVLTAAGEVHRTGNGVISVD